GGVQCGAGSNEETVTIGPAGIVIEGITKGGLGLVEACLNSSARLTNGAISRLLVRDEGAWLVDVAELKDSIDFLSSFVLLTSSLPLDGPFRSSVVSSSNMVIRKSFRT